MKAPEQIKTETAATFVRLPLTATPEQHAADLAAAREFHQIQRFVAACRRQWPSAMIVLRPNQDGPSTGASAPPNSATGTRSEQ